MNKPQLEVGRLAIVKVDEYGLLEVKISSEIQISGYDYYKAAIINVHGNETEDSRATHIIRALLAQGKAPDVLIKPDMLIKYK